MEGVGEVLAGDERLWKQNEQGKWYAVGHVVPQWSHHQEDRAAWSVVRTYTSACPLRAIRLPARTDQGFGGISTAAEAVRMTLGNQSQWDGMGPLRKLERSAATPCRAGTDILTLYGETSSCPPQPTDDLLLRPRGCGFESASSTPS